MHRPLPLLDVSLPSIIHPVHASNDLQFAYMLLTQYGITHAFVFEFANADDWRYYIDEDPAHWNIAKSIKDVLEKVQTVDFVDGVFSGKLRE